MSGRPLPYKRLLELAEQSQGFKIDVPGVHGQFVQVLPDFLGHWAVVRDHMFGHEYLTATGTWASTERLQPAMVYHWRLPQALQQGDAAARAQAVEHAVWQARHDAERAAALAGVVEEFLEPVRTAVAESAVA